MSDSLWSHGLQHGRLPCPSPSPRACSNSCPLSRWCHPTVSPSVPFSSCLQSFPASGSFPVSQFFTLGDQSIGVSASAPVLPINIQGWFSLGLIGLISLSSAPVLPMNIQGWFFLGLIGLISLLSKTFQLQLWNWIQTNGKWWSTILKVFIEFVTIMSILCFDFWL